MRICEHRSQTLYDSILSRYRYASNVSIHGPLLLHLEVPQLLNFVTCANSDPLWLLHVDSEPAFHFGADPDPDPAIQYDAVIADLCGLKTVVKTNRNILQHNGICRWCRVEKSTIKVPCQSHCCGSWAGSGPRRIRTVCFCFWASQPDPLVRGTDPDLAPGVQILPSSSKTSKKNLDSCFLWLLYDFLSLTNNLNVSFKK